MFVNPENVLVNFDIGPGMKVADIGAGSGFYVIESAKRVTASGRVYAVDIQKDLLDRIKKVALGAQLNNIEIIWGDAEKIGGTKLREALCDRVISSNILFLIEKKDDYCLEIKRILKPNGKLLVVDWSSGLPVGPRDFVASKDAKVLFERAGFRLEREISAGDNHYGLIFVR